MSLGHGAKIVREGLVLHLDDANPKSYAANGVWIDLYNKNNYSITNDSATVPTNSIFDSIFNITIDVWIYKKATVVGYALHPISKWNSGTTDASFVLYHMGDTSGEQNKFRWLANRGGTWGDIGAGYVATNGNYYNLVLQYNSITGGQSWVNGIKTGSRTGSGILGATSAPSNIIVNGPTNNIASHNVKILKIYNTELSDSDIVKNYNAYRDRYKI